jgi:hypothetical protein
MIRSTGIEQTTEAEANNLLNILSKSATMAEASNGQTMDMAIFDAASWAAGMPVSQGGGKKKVLGEVLSKISGATGGIK